MTHYRIFQPGDRPQLHEICRRTGDRGGDASATCLHPELLGDYYAVPYAEREPELCLVLEDAAGPCGYILGTADTRAFNGWFNTTWLPAIRHKYRNLTARPDAADAWLFARLAHDVEAPACADEYPAHLHIDLLPRVQGGGWGRRLFHAWAALAAARGARGLHLGVALGNARAIGFYERMGLKTLAENPGARIYGLKLGSESPC